MIRTIVGIALLSAAIASIGCLARSATASGPAWQSGYTRRPLPPVDEAELDSTLKSFRDELVAAIGRRDAKVIIDSVDPTMKSGLSTLQVELRRSLDSPRHADWRFLERVLTLGGSFTTTRGAQAGRREFCAPYTYSTYPRPVPPDLAGEQDPWVIIYPRIALRTEPKMTAAVFVGSGNSGASVPEILAG
jgi:hypothetical protein